MKKIDLAYFAGFFDGEGTILIDKYPKHYQLRVQVSQANRWILERYRMAFGGTIYEPYRNSLTSKQRNRFWIWQAKSRVALEFLQDIYPYLTLKQAEAKVAIEFQKTRSARYAQRRNKQTEVELAIQEAQRILVHNLKDRSKY